MHLSGISYLIPDDSWVGNQGNKYDEPISQFMGKISPAQIQYRELTMK